MALLKTNDLAKMVKAVKPGLAEKALVPGMTRILFTGRDIVTYNGGVCVHFPMDTEFTCSVSAAEFSKIINKVSKEETELEYDNDKGQLNLTAGRIKASFSTEAAVDDLVKTIRTITSEIPVDDDEDKWIPLEEDFIDAIKLTTPSASKNKQKGAACLLHCRETFILCSDNTKLAVYGIETPGIFMVDATEIMSIINMKDAFCYITEAWVHFVDQEAVVTSMRKRAGEFQYDKFLGLLESFPDPPDSYEIVLPDEFKNAIDTTSTFSEEDGKITVHITAGSMICSGTSLQGTAEYAIDFDYDGAAFEFPINLAWIAHVLDKTKTMKVDTKSERVLFTIDEFNYLVSMRRRGV